MPLPNEKKESQFIYDLIQSEVASEVIYESRQAEMILKRALGNLETRLEIKFQQSLELQRERIIEDFSKLESFKAEDKFGNSVEIIRKDQAIEIIKKL